MQWGDLDTALCVLQQAVLCTIYAILTERVTLVSLPFLCLFIATAGALYLK